MNVSALNEGVYILIEGNAGTFRKNIRKTN